MRACLDVKVFDLGMYQAEHSKAGWPSSFIGRDKERYDPERHVSL